MLISLAVIIDVFGKFLCLYPAYFCLAGGIGVVLLIIANRKVYTKVQKALIRCVILSLALTIIVYLWKGGLQTNDLALPLLLLLSENCYWRTSEKLSQNLRRKVSA